MTTSISNFQEFDDDYNYKLPFDLVGDYCNDKYFKGEFTSIINKIFYDPDSVYQRLIYDFYDQLKERIETYMDAGPLEDIMEKLLSDEPSSKSPTKTNTGLYYLFKGGLAMRKIVCNYIISNYNKFGFKSEEEVELCFNSKDFIPINPKQRFIYKQFNFYSNSNNFFKPSDFDSSIYIDYSELDNESQMMDIIYYLQFLVIEQLNIFCDLINQILEDNSFDLLDQIEQKLKVLKDDTQFKKELLKKYVSEHNYQELFPFLIKSVKKEPYNIYKAIDKLEKDDIDKLIKNISIELSPTNHSIIDNGSKLKKYFNIRNRNIDDTKKYLLKLTSKHLYISQGYINLNNLNGPSFMSINNVSFQSKRNDGYKGTFYLLRSKLNFKIKYEILGNKLSFNSNSELIDVSIPNEEDYLRRDFFLDDQRYKHILNNELIEDYFFDVFNFKYYIKELLNIFKSTDICPFYIPKYEKRINRLFILLALENELDLEKTEFNISLYKTKLAKCIENVQCSNNYLGKEGELLIPYICYYLAIKTCKIPGIFMDKKHSKKEIIEYFINQVSNSRKSPKTKIQTLLEYFRTDFMFMKKNCLLFNTSIDDSIQDLNELELYDFRSNLEKIGKNIFSLKIKNYLENVEEIHIKTRKQIKRDLPSLPKKTRMKRKLPKTPSKRSLKKSLNSTSI